MYYENTKIRWLLKNLINYKKNELHKKVIQTRKQDYNFENVYMLLQKEGFREKIIDTMKEIIRETKDRDDWKNKIFEFIIKAVDVYKNNNEKFIKVLNDILNQVQLDFKNKVKTEVGNTDDVKKFEKQKDTSHYIDNN